MPSLLPTVSRCSALWIVAILSSALAEPGLRVAFQSPGRPGQDVTTLPAVALYVPRGQSATPFLPAGPFQAVWTGFISVELRSEFSFSADLSGDLKLDLNGTRVLEGTEK